MESTRINLSYGYDTYETEGERLKIKMFETSEATSLVRIDTRTEHIKPPIPLGRRHLAEARSASKACYGTRRPNM